jgi:division protein CdvB (Snf7/Vps24/ESCRT-III family)
MPGCKKHVKGSSHLQHSRRFHGADSLLDEIPFEHLIITANANEKVINAAAVRKVFRECLERHLIDAQESLEDNMSEILKELRSLRRKN